jgi:hypothetical protein
VSRLSDFLSLSRSIVILTTRQPVYVPVCSLALPFVVLRLFVGSGTLLPKAQCPTACLVKGVCLCSGTPTMDVMAATTPLRVPRSPGDCVQA